MAESAVEKELGTQTWSSLKLKKPSERPVYLDEKVSTQKAQKDAKVQEGKVGLSHSIRVLKQAI